MGRGLGVDKPCVKCGRDVPYAYKSPIPGFCGRCTDEVLRTLQAGDEGGQPSRRMAALAEGGVGKGIAIGAVVALLLVLAFAVFAHGPFSAMVTGIRSAIGLG